MRILWGCPRREQAREPSGGTLIWMVADMVFMRCPVFVSLATIPPRLQHYLTR